MPELPEVETVAQSLYPHVVDTVITGATLLRESSLHALSIPLRALTGQRITAVGRRGKLLMFYLDPAGPDAPTRLVAHLRMTGRIFTQAANAELGKHTRCIIGLATRAGEEKRLFFDDTRAFGQLFAATPELLEKWEFWRTLGPEPLEMKGADLSGRLAGKRPIKTALLDQRVIAGIGNIYADESLFEARISPLREAGSLSDAEAGNLLSAIQSILRRSISQCGSSIRDYRDADGRVGAFQNTFKVYGKGGQACPECGHALQKARLGGRSTVYCPKCQH